MDNEGGKLRFKQARTMDTLLLGCLTYEMFRQVMLAAPQEIPFAGLLSGVTEYVVSRTIAEPLAWQGSTLIAQSLV
jgi:hypothetical protein